MLWESQEEPTNPLIIISVLTYCWLKGVLIAAHLHQNQETPGPLATLKAIQTKEIQEMSTSIRDMLQVGSPKQHLQQVEQLKQQQDKVISSGITKFYKPQDKTHILPGSLISGSSQYLQSHGYNQYPAVFSVQLVVTGCGRESPQNNANTSNSPAQNEGCERGCKYEKSSTKM